LPQTRAPPFPLCTPSPQVRTTTAVTGVSAGVSDNVLPQQGTIAINGRMLPGDSAADVVAHMRGILSKE
jgi:carboxypeptidase PM20D1